jgi:hypothetical protein
MMRLRPGGAPVYTLETRWLRQDHAQAIRDLRDHRRRCVTCEGASHRRKGASMCPEGLALKDAVMRLKAQADESARLDQLPHPDQEPLW